MPYEDIQQQTDSMSELASMPQEAGPDMGGAPEMGGQEQLGGPGVDTPQEQQAVQLLMQGAQAFRQAAETDPTVRHLVDKLLQDGFLQISDHYGFGEEGKMALKQAQMTKNRAQASAVMGQGPQQGPPQGVPQGPPQSMQAPM